DPAALAVESTVVRSRLVVQAQAQPNLLLRTNLLLEYNLLFHRQAHRFKLCLLTPSRNPRTPIVELSQSRKRFSSYLIHTSSNGSATTAENRVANKGFFDNPWRYSRCLHYRWLCYSRRCCSPPPCPEIRPRRR
ncbi:hypothetical protein BDY19DRAFT_1060748, partial [Irpex rosettiformis]